MQLPWKPDSENFDYDTLRRTVRSRLAYLDLDKAGTLPYLAIFLSHTMKSRVNEKCLCMALTGSRVAPASRRMLTGILRITNSRESIHELLDFVNAKKV